MTKAIKKAQRVCMITHLLTENPNKDYSLGHFAEMFGCAKSSISDDMKLVRASMEAAGLGFSLRESAQRLCAAKHLVEHANIKIRGEEDPASTEEEPESK